MLSEEGIKSSHTAWAEATLFALRTYGCFSFGRELKLTAVTKDEVYPLVHMHKFTIVFTEAAVFPKLDGNTGFWPVELKTDDRKRMASISPYRAYHFRGFQLYYSKFQMRFNGPWMLRITSQSSIVDKKQYNLTILS